MRRFFFDLLVDNVLKIDPGGMVFEQARATFVVADRDGETSVRLA